MLRTTFLITVQVEPCPKSAMVETSARGDADVGDVLEERNCYLTGGGSDLMSCSKECLGGCFGTYQDSCFACKNVLSYKKITEKGHDCMNQCPPGYLLVSTAAATTTATASF